MPIRTRSKRRAAAPLLLALMAVLVLTANAVAGGFWGPTMAIRILDSDTHDLWPEDLSASGVDLVAGWRHELADGSTREVWVRESIDSGDSFLLREQLAVDPAHRARDLSLDSGGGSHWAAWAEKTANLAHPHRWRVFVAAKPYGAGFWDYVPVSTNQDTTDDPTVAYTTGRLFVSYKAKLAGSQRALIQNARTDEGIFGGATNLGSASHGSPSLDATTTRAYVAWSDGSVRFRRATIGGSPDYDVAWQAVQTLGTGHDPLVVAGGTRVAVFYHNNGDIWVRLSSNSGVGFGAAQKLLDGNPDAFFVFFAHSAIISGIKIVLSASSGGDAFGNGWRVTSNNGGSTWSTVVANSEHADGRQNAFTTVAGMPKMAEIWWSGLFEPDERIDFHRQN